jgi:hypothetical protein
MLPLIRSCDNRIDCVEWSTIFSGLFTPGKHFPVRNELERGLAPELFWLFVRKQISLAPAGIRSSDHPVCSYTQYQLHSTSEISLNGPLPWWCVIMFTSRLRTVSSTVSWCCRLLLKRQFICISVGWKHENIPVGAIMAYVIVQYRSTQLWH